MMGLDHVNYFGKKTITRLLEKHGYKVETIKSSFEIKLFIMYTILPLLKRLRGNKKSPERSGLFAVLARAPQNRRHAGIGRFRPAADTRRSR